MFWKKMNIPAIFLMFSLVLGSLSARAEPAPVWSTNYIKCWVYGESADDGSIKGIVRGDLTADMEKIGDGESWEAGRKKAQENMQTKGCAILGLKSKKFGEEEGTRLQIFAGKGKCKGERYNYDPEYNEFKFYAYHTVTINDLPVWTYISPSTGGFLKFNEPFPDDPDRIHAPSEEDLLSEMENPITVPEGRFAWITSACFVYKPPISGNFSPYDSYFSEETAVEATEE